MSSYNKVILIGNIGNQPEIRYTPGNRPVTELRLAVSRSWTDKAGQRQDKTDWFSVELWDKQAEFAERYLAKGKPVLIEGRLATDEWTDKEGQKRTKTKIVAEQVRFVGARTDGEGGGGGAGGGYARADGGGGRSPSGRPNDAAPSGPGPEEFNPPEDDIPF
ncbi:MAG: single-stranded DNA-binding protein [Myxococcales bacterium]|nr:single-stranded DNA-binding protein [Myxococcales bacterium]